MSDKVAEVLIDSGLLWLARVIQFPPMVTKARALPGDDGARLDEEQVVTPAGPSTGQARPQDPAGRCDPWPAAGSLVDPELMAQCNDLWLQRQTRPERRGEKAGREQEKR